MDKMDIVVAIFFGIILVGSLASYYFSPDWGHNKEFYSSVQNESLLKLQILNDTPVGIIFRADYVEFTDGNLTITFRDEYAFLNFSIADYIEFNLKGTKYMYEKVPNSDEVRP